MHHGKKWACHMIAHTAPTSVHHHGNPQEPFNQHGAPETRHKTKTVPKTTNVRKHHLDEAVNANRKAEEAEELDEEQIPTPKERRQATERSITEGAMDDDKDNHSRHDDKRKDQRKIPQRKITQEMILHSKTTPASSTPQNPYDRPAMIPTPMQPPSRYATQQHGWGRPPANTYGDYRHPEAASYPLQLQLQQQMYASQQPYEYQEQYDLADHEMENLAERRPAADARHDH
jgi:hypothetical protein